jgi:small subunit ribosomal protein S27
MLNLKLPRELQHLLTRQCYKNHINFRTIVSAEFVNRDAWQSRLSAPVFKQVKMQEYFMTLDKKFTQEFRGSAIDVDIFANNVENSVQAEHMEELLFKLRRTPHTLHTLESTHHAAVRAMLDYGAAENLVKMLDDRMNYGLFLDEYSAVLTLDKLLESRDYQGAARCASQLMMQEEDFKLANSLGNLACWKYISSGREVDWFYPDEIQVDETPDEVVRVRVRTVPNRYTDHHFDLRDPDRVLGKTLIHFNTNSSDIVGRSLMLLGEHLFGAEDSVVAKLSAGGEVAKSVLDILEQSKSDKVVDALKTAKPSDIDLDAKLLEQVQAELNKNGDQMIQDQKNIYQQWSTLCVYA